MSQHPPASSARKRRVFYVMGFDPRGVKFYYLLFKWEARKRAARDLDRIDIGPLRLSWEHGYQSACQFGVKGSEVAVEYEFLSITDIVESYFSNPFNQFIQGILATVRMFLSGLFRRLWRSNFRFALFCAYPMVVLLVGGLIALWLGTATGQWALTAGAPPWTPHLTGLVNLALFLLLLRLLDERLFVFYLLADQRFNYDFLHQRQPNLEQRIGLFAERVIHVLREYPEDEVLVVGHSSGTMLACHLVAELLRRVPDPPANRLMLLTLGGQNSIALYPKGEKFRSEITQLVENPNLLWVDIFAPQDVISSGRFDPVKELSLRPRAHHGPHLLSACMSEALSPTTYREILHSFFRLHMQYLMFNETGRGFDYFEVLGHPKPLIEFNLGISAYTNPTTSLPWPSP